MRRQNQDEYLQILARTDKPEPSKTTHDTTTGSSKRKFLLAGGLAAAIFVAGSLGAFAFFADGEKASPNRNDGSRLRAPSSS